LRDEGSVDDFLGHLTTTQFCLVISPESAEDIKERIATRLDQSLDYFYPLKDRESSRESTDRLSISMGELNEKDGPFKDIDQLKTKLLKISKS
jgi:hypothetical protein